MSDQSQTPAYGYDNPEEAVAGGRAYSFGLNEKANMIKFEWIPNGGKDGAEQEALEIIFKVGDDEVSYRQFPVTRAYDDDNNEVTDTAHPAFKEAMKEFNQKIMSILEVYVDKEDLKGAFKGVSDFKSFCVACMKLLPKDYPAKDVDLFFAYQWKIKGEAKRTYLELPKKVKHGLWIVASVEPKGKWEEQRRENADDNAVALRYVDEEGNIHPFSRNGWFMSSNYANQQKEDSGSGADTDPNAMSGNGANTGGGW